MARDITVAENAESTGFATISESGVQGMILVRGALGSAKMKKAVKAACGQPVPATRRISVASDRGVGWMSPDELLIFVPYDSVADTMETLSQLLTGEHSLLADVSDARAVFRISGDKADQVLMKLCPVDLSTLEAGELRRTRAAQVGAALWRSGDEEFTLVCFRSVASYVRTLLETASRIGSELFVAAPVELGSRPD